MAQVKVIVLRTAGTNCDQETAFAFDASGARAELVHINQLLAGEKSLADYQILAFPGGFTYGDDIAAGRILANELKNKLWEDIKKFIAKGKLIIGICNGFQVLVKAGILPGSNSFQQEATLMLNDSCKFEDRWVYLKSKNSKLKSQKCVWAKDIPEIIYLPVAHAEGKFLVKDKKILQRLHKNNQIVFQYCDEFGKADGYPSNPNGSLEDIAGICDRTGRVLGLMPHPERHFFFEHHPRWTRLSQRSRRGHGAAIFKNGVAYAKKHL
ncbi:phosphoribosylformylglycinamidine synthase I [Candidatus Omnitrophota bacterium]